MPLLAIPYPQIDPVLISFGPFSIGGLEIGPLAIRWYSLAYIAGLLLGWRYILRLLNTPALWPSLSKPAGKKKKAAPAPDLPASRLDIDDLLVWVILGVIIGGRAGYVLFYQPDMVWTHPSSIFAVWKGGMSFHGGLLGVTLAGVLFCLRRRLDMWRIGDLVAAAAPIGLFFGRLANFINGELWGRPTNVPWAMVFPTGGPFPRHPSQLYEAGLEGLVLFTVLWLAVHRWRSLTRPGLTMGLFLMGYGLARITVEFFREPDAQIGYLAGGFVTMGMVLSLPMVLLGATFVWRASDRAPAWLKPRSAPAGSPPRKV